MVEASELGGDWTAGAHRNGQRGDVRPAEWLGRAHRFDCCDSGEPGEHGPGCDNHPGFDLMPDEVKVQIPVIYAQDGKGMDATAYVKLFLPGTGWTWYLTEYDPEDERAFGYTVSGLGPDCSELGYVSLGELRELRVGPGYRVERDLHWEPRTLREAVSE